MLTSLKFSPSRASEASNAPHLISESKPPPVLRSGMPSTMAWNRYSVPSRIMLPRRFPAAARSAGRVVLAEHLQAECRRPRCRARETGSPRWPRAGRSSAMLAPTPYFNFPRMIDLDARTSSWPKIHPTPARFVEKRATAMSSIFLSRKYSPRAAPGARRVQTRAIFASMFCAVGGMGGGAAAARVAEHAGADVTGADVTGAGATGGEARRSRRWRPATAARELPLECGPSAK